MFFSSQCFFSSFAYCCIFCGNGNVLHILTHLSIFGIAWPTYGYFFPHIFATAYLCILYTILKMYLEFLNQTAWINQPQGWPWQTLVGLFLSVRKAVRMSWMLRMSFSQTWFTCWHIVGIQEWLKHKRSHILLYLNYGSNHWKPQLKEDSW